MLINDLDDDSLSLILRLINLEDRLKARCVCKRWSSLIVDRLCRQQKTLKLFSHIYDLDTYLHTLFANGLHDDARFRLTPANSEFANNDSSISDELFGISDIASDYDLDSSAIERTEFGVNIFALFPNVRRLIAAQCFRYNLRLLAALHDPGFRSHNQLVSLTLISLPCTAASQNNLFRAIGDLGSLRELHLFRVEFPFGSLRLPVFAQLTQFSIYEYSHTDIVEVLHNLGDRLQRLLLRDVAILRISQIVDWIASKPSRLFTHLTLDRLRIQSSNVGESLLGTRDLLLRCIELPQCKNLLFLDYGSVDQCHLEQIFEQIAIKCSNLADLRLSIVREIESNEYYNSPPAISAKLPQNLSQFYARIVFDHPFPPFVNFRRTFPALRQLVVMACGSGGKNRFVTEAEKRFEQIALCKSDSLSAFRLQFVVQTNLFSYLIGHCMGEHKRRYLQFYNYKY